MPTYKELGFDTWVERRLQVDLPALDDPYLSNLIGNDVVPGGMLKESGGKVGPAITPLNVSEYIGDKAIGFDQLSVDTFQVRQYIRGGATTYDSGTGWWLGHDGSDYKFFIGNSSGNKLTWDGSTLTISGALSASTIDIGGSDATSFHVDIDGNMWLGAATFAAATAFKVSNAGVLTAISGTIAEFTLAATTL